MQSRIGRPVIYRRRHDLSGFFFFSFCLSLRRLLGSVLTDTPWRLRAEPRHLRLLRRGAFTSRQPFGRFFLLSIQVLSSNALTLRARRRLIGSPPKRGAFSSLCSPWGLLASAQALQWRSRGQRW